MHLFIRNRLSPLIYFLIIQKQLRRDFEKVLGVYGYVPARHKGSHKHYLNEETGDLITIKQENPLKKAYVVDVLNRIGE